MNGLRSRSTTAEHPACSFGFFFARPTAMEDAAVNRLAKSITQLTLCQVTTDEVDAATKLLDKACQKLRGIPDVPSQRITDLEAAIRQMRQLSCILVAQSPPVTKLARRKKPYCLCHAQPKVQARHLKS